MSESNGRTNKHRLTHHSAFKVYNALEGMAIEGRIDAWAGEIARELSKDLEFDVTSEQVTNMTADLDIAIKRNNAPNTSEFFAVAKLQRQLEQLEKRVADLEAKGAFQLAQSDG